MKKFFLTSNSNSSVTLSDSTKTYADFYDFESAIVVIDHLISQGRDYQFILDNTETFDADNEYSYNDMMSALKNCL